MLPSFGPRVTISANTGASLRSTHTSSARPSDANRRRGRPPIGPGCCASATLAQPTRKSLDGIKGRDGALRPEQLLEDVPATSLPAEVSAAAAASSIPHSVSAASLSSESDLALLLGACDASSQTGSSSTPLVFGSFPPVAVSLPTATDASSSAEQATPTTAPEHEDEDAAGSKAAAPTKLTADSHEFYPQAYLAAAATALAARTISSAAASRSASPAADAAAAAATAAEPADTATATAEEGVAGALAAPDTQQQHVYASAAAEQPPADPHQQQQYWAMQQQQQHAPEQWQQQQQAITPQQWHEQQQQWQQWQQQQQQAQHPQMVPMPVLVPVYVQPYPYPHYVQQQHPAQMHYVMMAPPDAAAAAAAASHQAQQQAAVVVHQQHQHQQHLHQMQVCPPSPGGHSLPADTCSLMSANTPAATPTAWQHSSHYSGGFSSRPGSSAGSIVSAYSSSSRRPRQHSHSFAGEQAAREAGAVTVSAMSCVKDAAGALAKVVTRNGNCLLLSLVKPGDGVAQATHVAAKSLAVARFYVNAHMAAAGAAGIDAAAALTGIDSTSTSTAGAAEGGADVAAAAAIEATVDDEVVFMPYHRSSSNGSSRAPMDTADVPLGFMVAKASARDLPVLLPPPVGIPACLQDKVQHGGQQQRSAAGAAGSSAGSSSAATLLKAGANTDVNKLSNAVIHNILGSGHVAMQLAGAAACHVAMRSLVKARDRLLRKFNTDIVATASFANEDTSSSIGRSTVFLRLDVMASNLLQKVADAGSAVLQAVDGQQQQQQQQLAGATA